MAIVNWERISLNIQDKVPEKPTKVLYLAVAASLVASIGAGSMYLEQSERQNEDVLRACAEFLGPTATTILISDFPKECDVFADDWRVEPPIDKPPTATTFNLPSRNEFLQNYSTRSA